MREGESNVMLPQAIWFCAGAIACICHIRQKLVGPVA